MSTSANGSVVDESGQGLAGLRVSLEDTSRVLVVALGHTDTDGTGHFSLTYRGDLPESDRPGEQPRQLRLRIQLGQHVLKEVSQVDASSPALAFGQIVVKAAEAKNWWATLGSGAPSRVTHDNALRWLVDNEDAWGRVATVIDQAATSAAAGGTARTALDVMQLQIDVGGYDKNVHSEKPRIVLHFAAGGAEPPVIDDQDERIERSLLAAARQGADVRIQIPKMRVDRHGLVTIAAITGVGAILMLGGTMSTLLAVVGGVVAVLGAATVAVLLWAERRYLSNMFGRQELSHWFEQAMQDLPKPVPGTVRVGELRLRSNFVTHAKIVIHREQEALLLGSPFEQVYFDAGHAVKDARRGAKADKGPIHDVSVGVRGPAIGHLQEVFNSHWNLAEPADALPASPPIPASPADTQADEYRCSIQVVRTLDSMFGQATDGEKGILEAYLRAIHFAERFIYIENQYFTNDLITQALCDALAAKPKLQVILLLNVAPDMHLYLGWQQKAIRRIQASCNGKGKDRLGVFSLWTHESAATSGGARPTLVDNYLHTKTAIVDNRWATVGSANLDGASLDFLQYARPILGGEVRNTETNVVVFEETPPPRPAVDALRRRLWAEHLGLAPGQPGPLDDSPEKDWLSVWRDLARNKREGLMQDLGTVAPCRVLEWPSGAYEDVLGICRILKNPHSHATAKPYLRSLLSPDDTPSDVVVSQFAVVGENGPPSFELHYPSSST